MVRETSGVGLQRLAAGDDVRQPAAQQRLSPGEPDLADAEVLDADPDQADDLVVGERLLGGQPVQALGRHAVAAAQVAPIGQRDAQVGRHASVAVEPVPSGRAWMCSPAQSRSRVHELRSRRGIPAESPLGAVRPGRGTPGLAGRPAGPVAVPPARRAQAGQPHRRRPTWTGRPPPSTTCCPREQAPGDAGRVAAGHGARDVGRPAHGRAQVPDPRPGRRASTWSPRWSPTTAPPCWSTAAGCPPRTPAPAARRSRRSRDGPGHRHRVGTTRRDRQRHQGQRRPVHPGDLLERASPR